jgi:hypothetical protein
MSKEKKSQQLSKQAVIEVKLTITAPFSTAEMTITHYGKMTYEATSLKGESESVRDSTMISHDHLREILSMINKNNFWSYEDSYMDENLMDAMTNTLTVKSIPPGSRDLRDAGDYSVSCYGECPEKIVEIMDKVKEIWGKPIMEVGI